MPTLPFAHPTLPGTYDRGPVHPEYSRLLFAEGQILQGAELNEMQTLLAARGQRTSNLVARDGDRIEGADIIVDQAAGTVALTDGKVYVKGDVRHVSATVLTAVPMTGEVSIGIRLNSTLITFLEEPTLTGLEPGTEAEGEPGAAREVETVTWGREGDGGQGALYAVYLLKDGVAIDQTPPPSLSGINAAIAQYDRSAHGHYVVRGCEVSALGLDAGAQVFSIARGEANIMGFKRTRNFDLRHVEPETPDTAEVEAEPRIYPGGPSATFNVYHAPISSVTSVTVEKEKTVSVTKGALSGSQDALPDGSIISLIEVKQGATTYVAGTDFMLTADKVDWTPSGAEPSGGSTYTVKYRYYDAVALGTGYTFTATSITVFGGVASGGCILRYSYKLPRTDLLCLDTNGVSVYVKGIAARQNAVAPVTPTELLKLAEISNTWQGTPTVRQAGIRSVPFVELWRYLQFMFNTRDLVNIERLKREVDYREPVAKLGSFVDPLTSDYYRDAGVVQSGAVFNGQLRLAVDPTVHRLPLDGPLMLDWTEEIVLRQDLTSFCMPINPYQNFDPLPAELQLNPPTDFWTEFDTQWLSPVTRAMAAGDTVGTGDAVVTEQSEAIPFLRQIAVAFTIRGFAPNEQLTELTFDGVDVKPPGTQTANASGVITGTFTIPSRVAAGTKRAYAKGSAQSEAATTFVGQGRREVTLIRQVILAPVTPVAGGGIAGRGGGGRTDPDPLAQTFTLTEGRFLAGVNLRFCAKGSVANGVLVELVFVENGIPTTNVIAQATVDMSAVVLNTWHPCRFAAPVYIPAGLEVAWVVKTDDAVHALSCARIGDADTMTGKRIAGQPYSVGVMLSSSNARTWTPHQSEDLAFQVVAARFAPVSKTYSFGSLTVTDMSDLMIPAALELPTADASLYFEMVRQNGSVVKVAAGQPIEFDEYISEPVTIRAVLHGTEKVSPVLYPDLQLVAGKIRSSGTYVSRAFKMGTAIRLASYIKALIPAGSSLTVECDASDGTWQSMPVYATEALDLGWIQLRNQKTPYTAVEGRLRITLTGSPAARPKVADLTAVVV